MNDTATFRVRDGSAVIKKRPDDDGSCVLSGFSLQEPAKPNFITGNPSGAEPSGAITLHDLYEEVKLDGAEGHFIDVTHPDAGDHLAGGKAPSGATVERVGVE